MVDAVERFLNWQSDQDWFWGPLLFLRPPKNVRMTLAFWLKLLGYSLGFGAAIGFPLGALLAYYDYTAARHHHAKIPPVVAAESWITAVSAQAVLADGALVTVVCILGCFLQHWAWNRRADRLTHEPLIQPLAAAPGVWPPPPGASSR